jgi:colanic acid/amylovoran biosynthesis glycosyltransferase
VKRKILDLPILLNSKLSHIYFPFGYNTTHRAVYGQYMGITSSVSFMGSDILVWPKQKDYDYRPLLEKIDKIHCNSTIIQEEVVKIEDNSIGKTQVIPSGLREEFEYKFEIKELMEIRKSVYQVKGEQIITIGRLNWIKGYESILQSLAILKRTQKFIYHIVGYGEDEYKLKTMVEKLGLEEFVVFHGYQNTREVIELLRKATLYVQTSWSEGFSNSVLEAQAMGLYSVVTPVSGMTDIINDVNKGIVLEDFQNEALTKCLERVLTLEHFQSRMEQTAKLRNGCLNRFGFKTFEMNWLAFFDNVA